MGTTAGRFERVKDGVTKYWVLLGLVMSFTLLAVTELRFFTAYPDWQLFLKEVAFALLIACVFGFTIERIQRREFVKLVTEEREVLKRDVFLYAYGHNIPEQIREEIRARILHEPFYRRNLTLEWEFSEISGQPELVWLRKEYSYVLVNNSAEEREWPFRFIQIGAADKSVIRETEFVVLRIRFDDETKEWHSGEITTELYADQPHMRAFSTVIRVRPQKEVHVYYVVLEKRKKADEDYYAARQPIVGRTVVRVRVSPPLLFDVTVACKTRPLQIAPDNDPPHRYSSCLDEGLLPFQGISISWSPREGSSPEQK